MEATHTETGSIEREIHIILSAEDYAPHKKKALQKVQANASIKGFRKGKAPLSLIEKLHGQQIHESASEEAVQAAFASYAQENNLQPFGTPYVTEVNQSEEGGLDFKIRYEILPEFELGDYKGLKARKLYHAVTPEEIDKEIEWLRERHRSEETVDTVADENHTAVVDFQKLDESGTPVIGDVSKDVPVNLRSEKLNPSLKEALLGKRLDEKVRISLPVGGDEGEVDVPYELTIKDVKHVALPELDDEFASKVTGEEGSDVQDLRDTVKQAIEAEYEGQYQRMYRDQLIDALIEKHEFDVPGALVGQIINSYIEEEKKRYKDGKLPENFPYQQFYNERRETAERVAQWLLLRDKILEAEGIDVTDEDFEGLAQLDAERMGMDASTLIEYYKGNDEVRQRILAEKVLQLLVDYSEVEEEIEDVEWQKQQEEAQKKAAAAEGSDTEEIEEAEVEVTEEEAEPAEAAASGETTDDDTTEEKA